MSNSEHEITETPGDHPAMRVLNCTCGYVCHAHENYVGVMRAQHVALPMAHLDPRLIHGA